MDYLFQKRKNKKKGKITYETLGIYSHDLTLPFSF